MQSTELTDRCEIYILRMLAGVRTPGISHIWEGSGIEGWLWLHGEWMGTLGYPRPFIQ